jgi:hypothetical protein
MEEKKKNYATRTRNRGGPISFIFFKTLNNNEATRFERKKREIEHQFFPIFQDLERNNKNFEIVLCSFKEKVTCLDEIRKCPTGESERCFCFFQ